MSDRIAAHRGRHLTSCPDQADEPVLAIDVLGPLRVRVAGRERPITGRRQRALLALFAMHANVVVPADRLADQLWDGAAPSGALVTLRSYISHLRKALGPVGATAGIVTTESGYRLVVDECGLDVVTFRRLVAAGHRHLRDAEPRDAEAAFEGALALWRGQPFAELADHEVAAPLLAELAELRTTAVEGRLRALLETGRHVEAVSGLEALVADEPLRESPHELLMVALYRSGRSADALDVHRRLHVLLRDQLGIDPSARLDQLVSAILNRDPRLDPVSAGSSEPVRTKPRAETAAELVVALLEALQAASEQTAIAVQVLSAQLAGSSIATEVGQGAVPLGLPLGGPAADAIAS